jgi:spore germination protein GerM
MTASVEIVIDERKNVLLVPNSTLKFKPTSSMLAQLKKDPQYSNQNQNQNQNQNSKNTSTFTSNDNTSDLKVSNNSTTTKRTNRNRNQNNQNSNQNRTANNNQMVNNSNQPNKNFNQKKNGNAVQLWYLDKDNKLKFVFVRTGLTDGQKTEILDNNRIEEGFKIISGNNVSTTQKNTQGNNNNRGPNFGGGGPRLF